MKHFALLTLIFVPLVGCASEIAYRAEPFKEMGVSVAPQKIFLKKGKLWVRMTVTNDTGRVLVVDKSQIRAQVGGHEVARETGTFGKNAKPVTIAAGVSHPIFVEFNVGDTPAAVDVLLNQGFIVDGKSLPLPGYRVTPGT